MRGLEVDDQLEVGRLIDGQIGGLGAVEDLSEVNASLVPGGRAACTVADQAAGFGEFARIVDHRNGMACRECRKLLAPAERHAGNEERAGMMLHERCEGGLDLAFGPGL